MNAPFLQTALFKSAMTWRHVWHGYRAMSKAQIDPWKREFAIKADAALSNAKSNLKAAKEARG